MPQQKILATQVGDQGNIKESANVSLSNIPPIINQKQMKSLQVNNQQLFTEFSTEQLIQNSRMVVIEQNGCRFIQKKIETQPETANAFFDSLETELLTLTCGSFGNYLIQKLLVEITIERIAKYIEIIRPFFVKIATSSHGTRVIQK